MTYSGPHRSPRARPYRSPAPRVRTRRRHSNRGPNPWIIVGSVLGGVFVIGLVIVLVMTTTKSSDSPEMTDLFAERNATSEKNQPVGNVTPFIPIPGGVREPNRGFISANSGRIQNDIRAMNEASVRGDFSLTMDYTYPELLEFMGGRRRAESALRTIYTRMRFSSMKIESLTFPQPPRFYETNDRYYAVVPVTIFFNLQGRRIRSRRHHLAIQEKGTATWKYIDGSGTKPELLKHLLPDLPSQITFPKASEEFL